MFCKWINKITAFLLVFVLAAMLIGAGSAPAYALVGVDDAAFLYTLWSAFGLKAGLDITTIGGDAFAQDAITGLYNDWQNSRVASGVQAAVSTLSDFVTNFLKVGTLVNPGSAAGGTLYTVLSLSAEVTEKLGQFWNWVIVDKLGGTTVDSVDFQQGSGNLCAVGDALPYFVASSAFDVMSNGVWVYTQSSYGDLYCCSNVSNSYIGLVGSTTWCFACSDPFTFYLANANGYFQRVTPSYNGTYFVYLDSANYNRTPAPWISRYSSVQEFTDFVRGLSGSSPPGSLTLAPDAGVDVLGFPDTGAQDYVPADTNIAINIPYDSTADLSDYIASGYDLALENDLAVGVPEGVIEGTGTVGPVGDYVVPGLVDVFPFCIPFDIYNFLEALAADPQAPHFTATLEFPEAVGGAQQIDIDFDNPTFNTLASILRTLELLAFCVGLAFVTRSFFIRG